jgi:hypothetical protein
LRGVNHPEVLRKHIEDMECERADNLKNIEELKIQNIIVREEINSLKEQNFVYIKRLKERGKLL